MSVETLERAGIDYEITYVGGSFGGLIEAAKAGLGVVCWARRLLIDAGLTVLDSARRLPKVPAVCGGVYLREGVQLAELDTLADRIAACVRGEAAVPSEGHARRVAAN